MVARLALTSLVGVLAVTLVLGLRTVAAAAGSPARRTASNLLRRMQNPLGVLDVPLIRVRGGWAFVDEAPVCDLRELESSDRVEPLPALLAALAAEAALPWRREGGAEQPRVAFLQADPLVSARIIKCVVATATLAGFPTVTFLGAPGGR
jgi:hypothetical protein